MVAVFWESRNDNDAVPELRIFFVGVRLVGHANQTMSQRTIRDEAGHSRAYSLEYAIATCWLMTASDCP